MTICDRRVRIRKRTREESSRWGSAAEVVISNDDLLSELLLRLPIKSLLKFKCMSKRWLSLITDPDFARRKYLKSNAVSGLYKACWWGGDYQGYEFFPLDASQKRDAFKTLKFAGYPHGLYISSSCNGLLCCGTVVCNPTTKQCKSLPPVPDMAACGFWGSS